MSYALVFAGQGQQHADMLPWLPDSTGSPVLAALDDVLGMPWRTALGDAARRHNNHVAQAVLTGTSVAAWSCLQPLLPGPPAVVVGYSVGEMAAYACTGVLHVADAVGLAVQRAQAMDRAAHGQRTGLMSVSGMAVAQMTQQYPALHCAIQMGPDHAIYGGLSAALLAAQPSLESAGAVCKLLDIAVASHTAWMAAAAQDFADVLAQAKLQPPAYPLVTNATAALCLRVEALQAALSAQICTRVDWAACMDAVAERGVACVLEVGPGSALSALWNRRHPSIPARSVDEFRSPMGAAHWLLRSGA